MADHTSIDINRHLANILDYPDEEFENHDCKILAKIIVDELEFDELIIAPDQNPGSIGIAILYDNSGFHLVISSSHLSKSYLSKREIVFSFQVPHSLLLHRYIEEVQFVYEDNHDGSEIESSDVLSHLGACNSCRVDTSAIRTRLRAEDLNDVITDEINGIGFPVLDFLIDHMQTIIRIGISLDDNTRDQSLLITGQIFYQENIPYIPRALQFCQAVLVYLDDLIDTLDALHIKKNEYLLDEKNFDAIFMGSSRFLFYLLEHASDMQGKENRKYQKLYMYLAELFNPGNKNRKELYTLIDAKRKVGKSTMSCHIKTVNQEISALNVFLEKYSE